VWRYLKRLGLRPANGYEVKPDGKDSRQATLKGKVRIYAPYGGDVMVDELKLIRNGPNDKWRVDPEEVDRTLKIRKKPR
jgi:hypothetical protein